jgi:hypothetical protein
MVCIVKNFRFCRQHDSIDATRGAYHSRVLIEATLYQHRDQGTPSHCQHQQSNSNFHVVKSKPDEQAGTCRQHRPYKAVAKCNTAQSRIAVHQIFVINLAIKIGQIKFDAGM